MCRDILDSRPAAEGLVDAAGVERELADQLTVRIDHADVLVGDQKADQAPLVGSAEADFVEPRAVAQADLARLVDLVLAHAEVGTACAPAGRAFARAL